ncbi:hypothetical protein [Prosthecobacter sp.]|uniref:hypothetical protein n=1 Tax=Prosthecobacter sp. TaxID=1965333 RepID=UPI0037852362
MNSLPTRFMGVAVLFWAAHAFSQTVEILPANGKELFQWLDDAEKAQSVADRYRTHSRALEAIVHADTALLSETLGMWHKKRSRNAFVGMMWRQLTQQDQAKALEMTKKTGGSYSFNEAALDVYGFIAASDPECAYAEVQRLHGPKVKRDKSGRNQGWSAGGILSRVAAAWFHRERLGALSRLKSLPAPQDTVVDAFKGFIEAATTLDERLALLERLASPEEPVIHEQSKHPRFCENLVRGAAHEDLTKTRAWIEKRFPRGQGRVSAFEHDWIITRVRQALFQTWAKSDPKAAADWLMAQLGPEDPDADTSMWMCAYAITGPDYEGLAHALEWLKRQTHREAVIAVIAEWLGHEADDTNERHSRGIITRWMERLPMQEREAILSKALRDCYYSNKPFQLRDDDLLVSLVFPDEASRKEALGRLKARAEPAEEPEVQVADLSPFTYTRGEGMPSSRMRGFDVTAERLKHAAEPQAIELSRKLAHQHHLSQTSDDPLVRLAGLKVLQWMLAATPAQIEPVLLAHLQEEKGEMTVFANDLIECWAVRDWRSAEPFVWKADLPAMTRRNMLIHLFCEAALRFPDDVLSRLRELIRAGSLKQDALNDCTVGSRAPGRLYYDCAFITESLARGWTRQNDVEALRKIQALPLRWQPVAFDAFSRSFTTAEAGLAMLDLIVAYDARKLSPLADKSVSQTGKDTHEARRLIPLAIDVPRCCGLDGDNWLVAKVVIERLAAISPERARAWLEAKPDRVVNNGERFDGVWAVYEGWRQQDAHAADDWLWRHRAGEDAMYHIVARALLHDDLDHASSWIEQHRDSPYIDSGLAAFAKHLQETQPQEAARYVLRMKGQLRQTVGIELMQSWQRTDPDAAARFMNDAFPQGTPARKDVDQEIKRLDDLMRK